MHRVAKYGHSKITALLSAVLLFLAFSSVAEDTVDSWTTDIRFGGCGGLYLLAEPGELWVEIEKSDPNRTGRKTYLRAILFGPDRHVIEEQTLPDDGKAKRSGPGPVQRVRLSTVVPSTGIYGVNVTVSEDRYGEDISWGFRTNCPRYLVETSRGHRDAPHEEPLVLMNPDAPGDVCFLPTLSTFSVDVTGLPAGAGALALYDGSGAQAGTLTVSEEGKATGQFELGNRTPQEPWRLHLPKFKGVVHIDSVTRWPSGCGYPNLSLWTPQISSWFPFHENRWLLTPYKREVYSESGGMRPVAFQVHNNGPGEKRVALSLEFPDAAPWTVNLLTREVTLGPGKAAHVSLQYHLPGEGDRWTCRLRATPRDDSGLSTYATFVLHRGVAPVTEPIPVPLLLEPYRHENARFGYLPEYPLTNQVYFDQENRPAIISGGGVSVRRENAWPETGVAVNPDGKPESFRSRLSKVAYDTDNGMYLIGEQGRTSVLLHSSDGGKTFHSYPIPGKGGFDIEQFSGHNVPKGPPPFVRYTLTAKDPKVFWRRLNDLALFLPAKGEDGALSIGEPLLLSKKCIGSSMHSGIPSAIVSRGSRVHVVWAEATEPEEKVPGVPTFVATYDRTDGTLTEAALVGYGPPANDVHNTPCITMDSKGYLHVLVGTHGRTFRYARSLEPNTAGAGWTEAEDIGPGLRQTYVGLVCGKDDTLHTVFRLWRTDNTYFPASHYACLAYMSKRPGEAWSEPRPLIVAPFSEYSVFYHRLTIDRAGQLFLSYDYWSTYWFYRTDRWGSRRALISSADHGQTWKLAELGGPAAR